MSEHQHFWGTVTIIHPPTYEARSCKCGARERRRSDGSWEPVQPSAEQQLAQALEKLDQSEGAVASLRLSLWETLHRLEEAQALLKDASNKVPMYWNEHFDGWECAYCGESAATGETIPHHGECPWLKIRVFLVQEAINGA